MDTELRNNFAAVKSNCKTSGQRKAYNKLISTFATDNQIDNLIGRQIEDGIKITKFVGKFSSYKSLDNSNSKKGLVYEDCINGLRKSSRKPGTLYAFECEVMDDYEEGSWHIDTLVYDSNGLNNLLRELNIQDKDEDKINKILDQIKSLNDKSYMSVLYKLVYNAIDDSNRSSLDRDLSELFNEASLVMKYRRGWREDHMFL